MNTDWIQDDNKLIRAFVFADFRSALAFVQRVGGIAEQLQHHPDITIQNYNQVVITTTTHDARNSVTDKDLKLAMEIDGVV